MCDYAFTRSTHALRRSATDLLPATLVGSVGRREPGDLRSAGDGVAQLQ